SSPTVNERSTSPMPGAPYSRGSGSPSNPPSPTPRVEASQTRGRSMKGPYARLVVWTAIGLASACSAAAAPKCTLARIADLPVRLERNHLVVDGTVNGQKVGVMLDTGARTFVVRPAAIR